jgi:predicted NBD/HSP70 family sugar kinase
MAGSTGGGKSRFLTTDFRVAQIVRKRMRTTRKEVAGAAYLTEVSDPIKRLIAADIVSSHNPNRAARTALATVSGRPTHWLTLSRELGFLIGIDIGHGRVSVTITRADFERIFEEAPLTRSVPRLDEEPAAALDAAADLVREAVAAAAASDGLTADRVIGIGVGLPAPVNRATKTIGAEMHILSSWSSLKPVDELRDRLADLLPSVEIEVDNDASLGALGVHSYETLSFDPTNPEATPPPRDLIYVRVTDGIGAGVVIKGKLVGGGSGVAGEIGHVKVDDRGRFCRRCGQRGCVETKSSERAVIEEVARTVFDRRPEDVTIEEVVARDHPACRRAMQEAGMHLGLALAHARTLLDPTCIYLGGALTESQRYFMPGVKAGLISNSIDSGQAQKMIRIAPAGLRKNRPDLDSPELLGAIAKVLHRCGDEYIKRRMVLAEAS